MTASTKWRLWKNCQKQVECYPSKSNIKLIFEKKLYTWNLFHYSQCGVETIEKITKYIMVGTKSPTLQLPCYPSNVFSIQPTWKICPLCYLEEECTIFIPYVAIC